MQLKPVSDHSFKRFGRVVEGYDFVPLLAGLRETTAKPCEGTIYIPSSPAFEGLPVFDRLEQELFGGMPLQLGYCNGHNQRLNCLEYHRGSELNIAADDIVLLLAPAEKIAERRLHTREVEAFVVPAGTAVLLYETALHYAPCTAPGAEGFRVAVALPRGTNTEKPGLSAKEAWDGETRLLWARNKWLIAHPESDEAAAGAFIGLEGPNITIE